MRIAYDTRHNSISQTLRYIEEEKLKNPNFKVVDIGGTNIGWSKNHIDFLVDINTTDTETSMQIDICDYVSLQKLIDYTQLNGLFDYAICSHTLEDVYNPFDLIKLLPSIAKSGIISMPSANTELSLVENLNWFGYIHHRWIFENIDDKMMIVPKLPVVSSLIYKRFSFKKSLEEINFHWNNSIEFDIFMDNYLGPDQQTVIQEYQEFLNKVKND